MTMICVDSSAQLPATLQLRDCVQGVSYQASSMIRALIPVEDILSNMD